jgi:hypothetical protein
MDKSTNFDSSHKSGVEGSKGQSSGSCAAAFLTVYVRTVVMHLTFFHTKQNAPRLPQAPHSNSAPILTRSSTRVLPSAVR